MLIFDGCLRGNAFFWSASENDSGLVLWEAIAFFSTRRFFWGVLQGMLIFDSCLRGNAFFNAPFFRSASENV